MFIVESINCNICLQSLDISEIEHHIKEKFHISRKNEMESELLKLKCYTNPTIQEGVIQFWKKNN
jgi:hypothetical protein